MTPLLPGQNSTGGYPCRSWTVGSTWDGHATYLPPPLIRDIQARLATPGDEVIVPADAGQLACLAAIDDADYIIQDEVVLKSGVAEAASLSYNLFQDCDSPEKLVAVLYGSRPNVVLVGEMTEYDKIQTAIKRLLAELSMLGRFVAILLEPVSDDVGSPVATATETPQNALGPK